MILSFIIPTYNSEKYLEKCLNSIIKEPTKISYEILIIDDESCDNTIPIINSYIKKYPNIIRLIKQNHSGASATRNKGILESKGKFITFVDSDDEIDDNFFSKLLKEDIFNYDVLKLKVSCIDLKEYDKRFDTPVFAKLNGYEALSKFCELDNIFATTWSYIINKNFLIKNNLFFKENVTHEDYLFIPLVLSKAKKVKSANWNGYKYFKRVNSTTTISTNEMEILRINDFINNTYLLMKYFQSEKNFDCQKICQYFYRKLCIKISHLNIDILLNIKTNILDRIEKINNKISHITDIKMLPKEYYITIKNTSIEAQKVFNTNLVSIILGGSCGKGNPILGWSDIDLYVILKKYDANLVKEFTNIIAKKDIHIGITYYSYMEVIKKLFDGKTKVMLYEKQNYAVNPTIYGFCDFPKICYEKIRENDSNNLPNIIHEFRRLYIDVLNGESEITKKYIKKLLVLLKCYMNKKGEFLYGYQNVVNEFLKIYNQNLTKPYYFDIIGILTNEKNSKDQLLDFSARVLHFIIYEKEDN